MQDGSHIRENTPLNKVFRNKGEAKITLGPAHHSKQVLQELALVVTVSKVQSSTEEKCEIFRLGTLSITDNSFQLKKKNKTKLFPPHNQRSVVKKL